jgi:hypothetical protein
LKTFLTQIGSTIPLTPDPPVICFWKWIHGERTMEYQKIAIWRAFLQKRIFFSPHRTYPPARTSGPTCTARPHPHGPASAAHPPALRPASAATQPHRWLPHVSPANDTATTPLPTPPTAPLPPSNKSSPGPHLRPRSRPHLRRPPLRRPPSPPSQVGQGGDGEEEGDRRQGRRKQENCWLHHPQLDVPKSSSAGSTGGRPRGIRGTLRTGRRMQLRATPQHPRVAAARLPPPRRRSAAWGDLRLTQLDVEANDFASMAQG